MIVKKLFPLIGSALAVLTPASVSALDLGVDAHAGTMGLGAGAALQFNPHLNMRVGLNKWDVDKSIDEEDGLHYEGQLKFDNQYALLDFYPSRNGSFHLSAGFYLNDNEVTGTAEVLNDGDGQIGQTSALAGTRVMGKITFDNESGYLGVGWGNTFSRGMFSFGLDLGVVLQGSPKAQISVTLPEALAAQCETNPNTNGCVSDADIRQEEGELEDEIKDYDVHPLVQATFGFSF